MSALQVDRTASDTGSEANTSSWKKLVEEFSAERDDSMITREQGDDSFSRDPRERGEKKKNGEVGRI